MQLPAELLHVAHEVVWFKEPEETLADARFFLAHVMTYGTIEEIAVVRKYFTPAQFREALENAPAGVFDPRSWAYWNTMFDRVPVPEMPRRHIP
jgi:hypothetical protein